MGLRRSKEGHDDQEKQRSKTIDGRGKKRQGCSDIIEDGYEVKGQQ